MFSRDYQNSDWDMSNIITLDDDQISESFSSDFDDALYAEEEDFDPYRYMQPAK